MAKFAFFYMWQSTLTSIICRKYGLFYSVYFCSKSGQKSGALRFVDLCLALQLYPIHQHVCFYANAMPFLVL